MLKRSVIGGLAVVWVLTFVPAAAFAHDGTETGHVRRRGMDRPNRARTGPATWLGNNALFLGQAVYGHIQCKQMV